MAEQFTQAEWDQITAVLDADPGAFGLPERRDGSVVITSWNIRKFGAVADRDGRKKSAGAFDMIVRVCAQSDLVAIQEVQRDTESVYLLRDRLAAGGDPWGVVISDVTGMAPGYDGMAERSAYLYREDRVRRGDLASDLSFDRSAVVGNMNEALATVVRAEIDKAGDEGFLAKVRAWMAGQTQIAGAKLRRFVQFIRTPHLVEFVIEGPGGAYEFYCVNAHLVSGKSKREREDEFLALLEWLMIDSKVTVAEEGKTYVLLADLNLDFQSNVDKRRAAFADYVTSINAERGVTSKVNFPFLDGGFFTNARRDETFDHIAWVSSDTRMPRGRHNPQAGSFGADEYDYGMFDFVKLFVEAGPGQLPDGSPDYDRFAHDFTDHMPIWVRLPIPHAGQVDFSVDD